MDIIGNVWTWDVGTIAALDADGAVAWQKALFPAPAGGCPEVLTQVAATDFGTLAFGVGSLAEGFTCFPNGIPEAAFIFSGNSSDGRPGSFAPAGPLAISSNRILYPTRFVAGDGDASHGARAVGRLTGASQSTAAGSDAMPKQPAAPGGVSAGAAQLYLAALDQNTEGVSRMTWAWTAALPAVAAQSNSLPCLAPQIAGPMVVRVAQTGLAGPFADVAVIAASCNGSAILSAVLVNVTTTDTASAKNHDDGKGSAGAASVRGKFPTDDPNILICPSVWSAGIAPCLLWTRNVTLAGSSDSVLALAADRTNAAAAAAGAEDIWLSTAGLPGVTSSQLMRFDGLTGAAVASIDLGSALLQSSGPQAGVVSVGASPGWMLLSGSTIAVAFRADTANATGAASAAGSGVTAGDAFKTLAAACGASVKWEGSSRASGGWTRSGSQGGVSSTSTPLYGVAAFNIGSNSSATDSAPALLGGKLEGGGRADGAAAASDPILLWCSLTPSLDSSSGTTSTNSGALPGTYPVVGQPAAIAPGVLQQGGAGALVIVTAEGAIAAIG